MVMQSSGRRSQKTTMLKIQLQIPLRHVGQRLPRRGSNLGQLGTWCHVSVNASSQPLFKLTPSCCCLGDTSPSFLKCLV